MSVVVGYVATPEGSVALDTAVAEARRRSARLVVVISGRGSLFSSEPTDVGDAAEGVRERLDEAGVAYEIRETSRGRDAADDIIAAAEAEEAELIVIGLRRRSPVGKLLLGSNAQRILLDAGCPVLAVKPVVPA